MNIISSLLIKRIKNETEQMNFVTFIVDETSYKQVTTFTTINIVILIKIIKFQEDFMIFTIVSEEHTASALFKPSKQNS